MPEAQTSTQTQTPEVTTPPKKIQNRKGRAFTNLKDFANLEDDKTPGSDGAAPESTAKSSPPEGTLRAGNQAAHETPKEIKESTPGEIKAPEKKKYTFKVDGQDIEEELDDDEVRRRLQLSLAANKRFEESANERKYAREIIGKLKDPNSLVEALQQLGYDPQQLAEGFIYDKIKFESMDEKDKLIYQLKEEKRIRDWKEAKDKERREQGETASKTQKLAKEIQDDIIGTLKSHQLAATPDNIWRMGHKMRSHLEKGIVLTSKDAADLVLQDLRKEYRKTAEGAEGDRLIDLLGPETVEKLRKYLVSKVSNPIAPNVPRENQPKPKVSQNKKHFITEKESAERIAKRLVD